MTKTMGFQLFSGTPNSNAVGREAEITKMGDNTENEARPPIFK